ncbi:MAG: cytochrome c oxidase accessory protein CcoG [Magnetococcus sp. DMHC-6]
MSNEESLYAEWKKIYPRSQSGFFRTLRWRLSTLFLGIYFFLPFLRWDRGESQPNQAILFDIYQRKFFIFDLIIWPQDIFVLAFLLIAAALGLFFMTALAGRVFCGYLCIQTVWTDLFLLIEKLFEGNRKQRIKRDSAPWNGRKILIKTGKHLTWFLLSLWTGLAFILYFADTPTLLRSFIEGTTPSPAWFTMLFLTFTTYTMAGFAREQVCIYMCPYARFQGAMFDEDSLIIAYHPEIGEPREANRQKRVSMGSAVGQCIDCQACVTVCPTGIDIRNGQQYECITCGACIDACDDVMNRLGKPKNLIRYTSLREMTGAKTNWFRPRILVYSALLSLFLLGIVGFLAIRPPMELTILRHRQPLYILLSNGDIQNNYTLRILNMSNADQTYAIQVEGLPKATWSVATNPLQNSQGAPLLPVKAGEIGSFTLYLRQPHSQTTSGSRDIDFRLTALDTKGGSATYHSVFIGP